MELQRYTFLVSGYIGDTNRKFTLPIDAPNERAARSWAVYDLYNADYANEEEDVIIERVECIRRLGDVD